jgi:aspartokinase
MAEAVGRLAAFDGALAEQKIAVIDSQGDGVDGQKYFVDSRHSAQAFEILNATARHGSVISKEGLSLITLVGFKLERRLIDNVISLALNSGINGKVWQSEGHDLSSARHSLRLSIDTGQAQAALDRLHRHFIEGYAA